MKKRLKDIFKKLESKIRTVFVPDNYSGNELPLEEYYFSKKVPFTSICGKEASCQLNWIENAISCSPGLKIKAAGFSKDYSENWIKIDRIPYSTPIPSGNFDGIGIWLQTDGSGGNFHLSLTDPSGVEYTVSDNSALKIPGWRKLVYSFNEFKIADWSKKKSQEKMTSFINYSFSINLIPDKEKDVLKENLTIGKVFLIDAESPINSIDTVLSGFDFIPADFYRNSGFKYSELNIDNIDFFLFASSGDDSIINILPEQKKENANCTGIKVNYSINSNDHNCNHITIRSLKFHEIIDFNSFHGLIITIDNLTESCGELRFTIEDDSGNRASVSLYRVFNSKCVNRFYISRSRFILLDKPLKNISSYEFSISSHWNNIPIKNEFYLFPPDFISNNIKTESLNIPVVTSENLQPVQKIQEDCKVTAPLRKWWGLDRAAIFIEPTNLCNLRCIMCNHGNFSFKRPIGVMKFDNYKKILDEIDKLESNIWEIGPYWLGESFIHPQINQILSYTGNVKKHGNRFNNYTLHTNGILLEEKHFETLIESEIDHLLFSIDAATSETYRKIRRGGELNQVVEKITAFKKFRDKNKCLRPALIVQFIVMDENVSEIEQFANFWTSRGFKNLIYSGIPEENPFGNKIKTTVDLFPYVSEDSIFIKRLEPNALTKKQTHREIIKPGTSVEIKRKPCASLWKMLSISWDGKVTACCRDDQTDMEIGNVFEENLEDIWFGKKLEDLRLSQILGDFEATPKCLNCVNWVKYHLTDEEIKSYLYSINKKYLFDRYTG